MELRHLRYCLVLADELHFGRAAERLAMSQPPLSVAIQQLEEAVGTRLLERNSKSVRLTAAGKSLAQSAAQVLQQAEEAKRLRTPWARARPGACAWASSAACCFAAGRRACSSWPPATRKSTRSCWR